MNKNESYIKVSDILEYCRESAKTNRELASKCIKSVGKGESETSSLGGAAYFLEQARIFEYDVPTMLKALKVHEADTIYGTPVEELGLSVRAYTCLKRGGIETLGDITNLYLCELEKIRYLGKKSFDEILQTLKRYGVRLKREMQNTEVANENTNN